MPVVFDFDGQSPLTFAATAHSIYGLTRVAQVPLEESGVDTRPFRELADAINWLTG